MKFGPLALDEAEGALLAHSLRVEGVALRKGHSIGPGDVRALHRAGVERVMAVRPEAGDLDENRAALEVAAHLAGAGIGCSAPANGRVKMYAKWPGLAGIEEHRVREVNACGESLALATLAPLARVERRQVVATLKVLPLAVSKEEMEALSAVLAPAVSVRAFRPLEVGLLQTRTGSTRAELLEKTRAVTQARVESLGGVLSTVLHCDHHEAAVADSLVRLRERGLDLLLMIGASASVDRRDCVPRGIENAGGEVASLGLPLDPGHLTLLARCGKCRCWSPPAVPAPPVAAASICSSSASRQECRSSPLKFPLSGWAVSESGCMRYPIRSGSAIAGRRLPLSCSRPADHDAWGPSTSCWRKWTACPCWCGW